MKAYKIYLSMYEGKVREIISEAVQRKAFELGYAWCDTGKKVFMPDVLTVIHFTKEGTMHGDAYEERTYSIQEISAADFLALTTAKDEPTFKPFDKVLVRDDDKDEWQAVYFSHMRKDGLYQYCACGQICRQCIPYEGNEHLLGTTDAVK